MLRACVVTLAAVAVASGASHSRAEEQIRLSAVQNTPTVESQPAAPAATDENPATTGRPTRTAADETDILPGAPPRPKRLRLAGPRIGITHLSDGVIRKLRGRYGSKFDDFVPVVSQFGWQWEKQIGGGDDSFVALSEWVLLVGGLDQGVFLPSLSWLVGIRSRGGVEFGVGPNVTPAGTAVAIAAGATLRAGALSFPLNLAVVPSKSGVRVSLLCGFTTR